MKRKTIRAIYGLCKAVNKDDQFHMYARIMDVKEILKREKQQKLHVGRPRHIHARSGIVSDANEKSKKFGGGWKMVHYVKGEIASNMRSSR